jgi:hypothetical protein
VRCAHRNEIFCPDRDLLPSGLFPVEQPVVKVRFAKARVAHPEILEYYPSHQSAWPDYASKGQRSAMVRTELLRYDGVLKRDPAINAWLEKQPGELGTIARQWFQIMRNSSEDVSELLHDGCPVACLGDFPFAYVNVFTAHVNVGFYQGAALPDPARLLQGTGKFMRHVKLKPGTPTNIAALTRLVETAYSDIKSRVKSS